MAAAPLAGTYFKLDPDNAGNYVALRAYLDCGQLVLAQVFSGFLDAIMTKRVPPAFSPHGRLCTIGFGHLHSVLLVGYSSTEFYYLDPFFSVKGQPFTLGTVEFAGAFQGEIVVAAGP